MSTVAAACLLAHLLLVSLKGEQSWIQGTTHHLTVSLPLKISDKESLALQLQVALQSKMIRQRYCS